jgi:cytochrome P450
MTLLDDFRLATSLNLMRLAMWRLRRGEPLAWLDEATTHDDPYPLYERLRGGDTFHRSSFGVSITVSHAACSQLLRDPRLGHRPPGSPDRPARYYPDLPRPDGVIHPTQDSFIVMDPPEHTRLRRLVSSAFTPRALGQLRPRVERVTDELLGRMDREATVDLVDSFAAPLPIQVICELLGVPHTERARFARWGAVVGATVARVDSVRQAHQLRRTLTEMNEFFDELIASRRGHAGEDVIGQLTSSREELSRDDLMATCLLLFVAGFETTVNLIGNGVLALLRNPDQLERFHADPELAPNLVEEVLRYDPPVQRTGRVVQQELEFGGTALRPGEMVLFLLAAANRDPEVFRRPDRFDIGRDRAREHLAFSAGIHYCLGASLSRMEGDVAFRALRERLPRMRLAAPVRRRPSQIVRGPLHMPLRLEQPVSNPV